MSSAPEEPESASEPSAAAAAEPVAVPRPLPPLPQGEPVWVDTAAGLAAAAERWMAGPTLALDTEFVRERTFFPRLGLIQVADASTIYLVDPLAVRDLSPLAAVCRAPGVLKVLHSASEDVEVFYRAVGAVPAPLFDTQVAAGLAGIGASLGYQRLVATLLGVELPKGETRTDWMARPLSAAQLAYAAEDVAFLLPVFSRLWAELERLGRGAWAREDSCALLDVSRLDLDPEAAYKRVRGGGRLTRRQLGVLRALASWRDREARRRDLPRSFVLREEALLNLAVRQPLIAEDLRRLAGADAHQVARDGAAWLECVRQAAALDDDSLPPEPWRPPGSAAVRELERRLREVVRERAALLGLPPELLAARRALDAVLRSALVDEVPRLPRELCGWRREVVGDALLQTAVTPVESPVE